MNVRRALIRTVTFLAGLYFFLEFVLPESLLVAGGVKQYHEQITNGFIVVGVMALGLGVINLLLVHGTRIAYFRKGWRNSTALLLGMAAMFFITGLTWLQGLQQARTVSQLSSLGDFAVRIETDVTGNVQGVRPQAERVALLNNALTERLNQIDAELQTEIGNNSLQYKLTRDEFVQSLTAVRQADPLQAQAFDGAVKQAASNLGKMLRLRSEQGWLSKGYTFLYEGLFISLGAAMFSLLGVYIAAAAYRAFRIRSVESSLMMMAAVVVMLGQIPFGMWISEDMPAIRQWLLEVPNSAAFRAIRIGSAVAGLIMAIRMWLSIESESFNSKGAGDA